MPEGTVFIGNVPYDATEASLTEIFCECGPVRELRLVAERDTGKLKGYGFVEFDDFATAMSAVRNLNGREYNGRQLRVDHAETMKNGGGQTGVSAIHGDGGVGHAAPSASASLRADAPIGTNAAKASQQGMRHAFEGVVTSTTGAAMDLLTKRVADLTPTQLYEIMSQVKQMTESDPAQARTLLVNNPQLSLALFQAQLVLGMVKPPAGGATAPPMAPHLVGQQARRTVPPPPPPPVVRAVNVPPPPMAPVRAPPAAPVAPMAPPSTVPGQGMDQQQALLRQVLSMTPQQIAMLPPDQRAQVEYLRQLAAQQGMVRVNA
ncbi:hypothetical protein BE221DRAFT_356 [Ostreococcus tauri]|uniref:RRM domain-containing protein n=1 Tax=Ostreococcus tauri TaxID=70448 RepID=A0A1Y5HYS4_OSTTA|nr:hypothetical protein BE221DRAFT_356 [Ostreococcus tauri]